MRRARALVLAVLAMAGWAGGARAQCTEVVHLDASYTICEVSAHEDRIALFLRTEDDRLIGQFSRVDATLEPAGQRLAFAMNAGMYHPDRDPVGLYIEDGVEHAPLVTSAGPGNFGLLPNGVFCIREGRADVIETKAYALTRPACRDATQSGPMLVIDGALHPRFLPDSTSRYVRNGVGTSADGARVVFAISNERVTFHDFATLFRDRLGLPNALYFDGNTSRLYAPEMDRYDSGFPMGPIVGVIEPRE